MMQSETLKLHSLAHNEFLSDVIISFKVDAEMEKVNAHKLILGCASSKFFEMLKAHPEAKELSIDLDRGFSKQIVDKVLELAYLQVGEGDMRVEQEINMLPTARDSPFSEYISLSAFFGFTRVQAILSKKILQQSSNIPATALNLLQTAINTNPDKQLFGQALQTLAPHFQQCLMNTNNISQLLQLPFDTFKQIIDCDQLDLRDETDILHLVYQYILFRETSEEEEDISKQSQPQKVQTGEEKKDSSGNQEHNLEINEKEPEQKKQEQQVSEKNTHEAAASSNEQQGQEPKGDAAPAQNTNEDSNKDPATSDNNNPTEQNLPKVEAVPKQEETQLVSELVPQQNQPEGEEQKLQSAQQQVTLEQNQEQGNKKIETNSKTSIPNKTNTKDLSSHMPVHKLTREQKASLLLSVRLGQVSHESLLKYSDIDILREFKELFLQALSFKLSALQPSQSDFIPLYQFNLKPRISQNGGSNNSNNNYSNQMDFLSNRVNQGTGNANSNNIPGMQQLEPDIFSQGITNRSEFKQNLNKMSSHNNLNEFNQTSLQEIHNDLQGGNENNKNNNSNPNQMIQMNNMQGLAQGIAQQFLGKNNNNNNAEAVNSYVAENMPSLQSFMANLGVFQSSLQQQQSKQQGQQPAQGSQQQQQFQQGNFTENQYSQQQQLQINQTGQLRAPQSMQDQQQPSHQKKNSLLSSGLRAPQALFIKSLSDFSMGGSALVSPNNRSTNNNNNNNNLIPQNSKQQPIQGIIMTFTYSYDMDENGALFYLGTYGKKRNYMNPQAINLAVAFASSVRTGNIQSFIGRESTNLSTCNERMSFMGVDLGKDRMLRPSAYSIRNRNATTYCVLNWKIEGSIDGTHFIPFDERIHYEANDEQLNQQQSKQRELLLERGGVTSYGVDEKIVARLLEDNGILGFRYFRIVQISANSHSSDNLSLSGFELYGAAIGRGWILENINN